MSGLVHVSKARVRMLFGRFGEDEVSHFPIKDGASLLLCLLATHFEAFARDVTKEVSLRSLGCLLAFQEFLVELNQPTGLVASEGRDKSSTIATTSRNISSMCS